MCVPNGIQHKQMVPMIACFVALTLSGVGSWHCSYFKGATISFTGDKYGLWTMQDISGKCQLWDILFFSYDLGGHLIAARCFSMATMLIGLALLTTMAQALEFHAFSWGIGMTFFVLFLVSVCTTSIYNVWIVFWLFTYVLFILIVRSLFVFPVHRRISGRGTKIVAFCFFLCGLFSLLTLVVLGSDFCTCSGLSAERLEGRVPGYPCEGTCHLHAAGYLQVFSSVFWFLAAGTVLQYGVQPKEISECRTSMYAHYPRNSITTRALQFESRAAKSIHRAATKLLYAPSRMVKKHGKQPGMSLEGSDKVNESDAEEMPGLEPATTVTPATTSPSEGVSPKVSFSSRTPETGNHLETAKYFDEEEETQPENMRVFDDDDDAQLVSVRINEEEDEEKDTRPRCSKICCDYRVKARSHKEKWAFWLFRVALGLLVATYIFLVVVLIGARVENTNAAKAPDTSYNFITDVVCAFNPLDQSQPLETFATKEEALNAGYIVAHCGECGFCSNPRD